jgi:hypothetical protein
VTRYVLDPMENDIEEATAQQVAAIAMGNILRLVQAADEIGTAGQSLMENAQIGASMVNDTIKGVGDAAIELARLAQDCLDMVDPDRELVGAEGLVPSAADEEKVAAIQARRVIAGFMRGVSFASQSMPTKYANTIRLQAASLSPALILDDRRDDKDLARASEPILVELVQAIVRQIDEDLDLLLTHRVSDKDRLNLVASYIRGPKASKIAAAVAERFLFGEESKPDDPRTENVR